MCLDNMVEARTSVGDFVTGRGLSDPPTMHDVNLTSRPNKDKQSIEEHASIEAVFGTRAVKTQFNTEPRLGTLITLHIAQRRWW